MPNSDIDDAFADARVLLEEEFYPNTFALQRGGTRTRDTSGGFTVAAATTVAAGLCRLRAVGSGSERVIADRQGWQQPYAVDLDPDIDVRPSDTLIIDGSRPMTIGGVINTRPWTEKQTVICQETSQ